MKIAKQDLRNNLIIELTDCVKNIITENGTIIDSYGVLNNNGVTYWKVKQNKIGDSEIYIGNEYMYSKHLVYDINEIDTIISDIVDMFNVKRKEGILVSVSNHIYTSIREDITTGLFLYGITEEFYYDLNTKWRYSGNTLYLYNKHLSTTYNINVFDFKNIKDSIEDYNRKMTSILFK